MPDIELLAPARDLACGKAAIDCGADAVYIGAPEFGARRAAGNRVEDIAALAAHAHRFWAKVYPAVNTLLTDAELPRAVRLLWELYEAGADGLIIQDPGLLELDLPPLPLIASTQMHNHTPARVRFLEDTGFKRVILARELSLAEIRAIRDKTSVELECFVHGALCVSFSGQCWMSYALGRRSGNRGDCAQPCRRRYTLADGTGRALASGRHLLSLKDLDLSPHLGLLLDAGITSFKIEGRLKERDYVMNVTAHYRRSLDPLLASRGLSRASSGTSEPGFDPDPAKTFNRGRTTYRLLGEGEDIASPDTPTSLGEEVGRAADVRPGSFTLTRGTLSPGDGICWFDADRRLEGTYVREVRGGRVFPESLGSLKAGTKVRRNLDRRFQNALKAARPSRTVSMELELTDFPGGLELRALDEDGIEARAVADLEPSPARDSEAAAATARTQLLKLGGTMFRASVLRLSWSRPLFVPVGKLNALRRDLAARLEAAREERRPRERPVFAKTSVPFPEKALDFRANVLNAKARAFYRRHEAEVREGAAESGLDLTGRPVMTTKLCLRRLHQGCPLMVPGTERPREVPGSARSAVPGTSRGGAMAAPLFLLDEDGRRFRLEFDCAACVMVVFLEG